jgi:hypothetical protein
MLHILHSFKIRWSIVGLGIVLLLASCDAVKRVPKEEYLITKNQVLVDDKVNKNAEVNNLIIQKENGKIALINSPFKLHLYNLARPNIDSIIKAKVYDNPKKMKRRTALYSRKQLENMLQSKRDFNAWLKKIGEAPSLLDETKTIKTQQKLRAYYFKRGWLDNEVDYTIKRDSNKRAEVTYRVTKNTPYVMDSLKLDISTPALDSIFRKHQNASLLKKGQQYNEATYTKERERINTLMRNSGVYYFGLDNVSFELDTIGKTNSFDTDLIITDRLVRGIDSSRTQPFKIYNIRNVNIFTDVIINQNDDRPIKDSVQYNGYHLYSYDKLKYKPKALTDAIFIKDSAIYRDLDRSRTLRYLNQLQNFRYPSIEYVENIEDTTLTANIYLAPRKKYNLFFEPEISTSNIQTVGLAFNTGLKVRNAFRGAETLDFSLLTSIGASREGADPGDPFFDIVEFGGNIGLTVPRFFLPFETDKIVPKYMSPTTRLNLTATSQTNIGLDKQSFSSILSYNWFPSETVTNVLDLLNVQFVNNLNPDAFFEVYTTSYDRLNQIAQDIGYVTDDLEIPNQTDQFIRDVENNNTSLQPGDEQYIDVINIGEREERLTENNLIVSTSFKYTKDTRENLVDNNFSILRTNFELAGNLLNGLSNLFNANQNTNGNYELFGVAFSQYVKTEVDFIKYWGFGGKNVLATRSYFGIAIPFGNSNNIPFAKSFFAGGPNDNRAWTAYNLGPGSVQNFDEFSEANLKIHFSLEQRFNLFGSFDGAIFVDAGNIWNVLDNVTIDAATFDSWRSLRDIAVGTGFGLRYDFSFFVARLDTGFKTYNPELELGRRWFTDFNFKNAVFNIGINYPF